MPTILELYNKGQRQFPMRGGGVSPPLFIYGHYFQVVKDESQGNGRPFQVLAWNFDGTNYDDYHALDLLPEPLPEPLPELETLKAKLEEKDKQFAEIEKLWAEYGEIYWDGAKAPEDRVYKTPESRVEWARDLADVECLLSAAIKGTDDENS